MNGCCLACCGVHLSTGFRFNKPWQKSMNDARLFNSKSSKYQHYSPTVPPAPTFLHLGAMSCGFKVRHWGLVDDIRQSCSLEILLSWLFVRVSFPRVLFNGLQTVLLMTKGVIVRIEEVTRLFPQVHHVQGRHPTRLISIKNRGLKIEDYTRASQRFWLFGYIHSFLGKEATQGTIPPRYNPMTTCRWQHYTVSQATPRVTDKTSTGYRCRPFAVRGTRNQSLSP